MKLKIKEDSVAQARGGDLTSLVSELRNLIRSARQGVATAVNTFQVMTNFEIGCRIVEHEQQGEERAEYGAEVLKELSVRLTEELCRGWRMTFCASETGLCHALTGLESFFGSVFGALPRAGMYSPFRTGEGQRSSGASRWRWLWFLRPRSGRKGVVQREDIASLSPVNAQ
ncbi:MAG: DUF1016 domain-containing protein [Lentisphaerae bacterium]|nr:DUF1016 domain-containing protein [Lentisphaerota bacterium]